MDIVASAPLVAGAHGVELCRRIRKKDRDTYTYFIFLTAFDRKADVISGIEAGADDYFVKPLDIDEMKMRLLVASRVTALPRQLSKQSTEVERLNPPLF